MPAHWSRTEDDIAIYDERYFHENRQNGNSRNFSSSFLFSAYSIQMKKHTEKLDGDEEVETFEKIKKKLS